MSRALKARNELAAATRHHPEQVEDKRRALAEAKIADFIDRTLATAPPLTSRQLATLAELLKPVQVGGEQ